MSDITSKGGPFAYHQPSADEFGRLKKEDTVFICCDIQEKLFAVMHGKESLAKNAAILVQAAKILEIPLIVSEQYPKGLGKTIPEVAGHFQPHTKIIEKLEFSALRNEKFHISIPKPPHALVIFGIETHICVLQTALDAKAAGYEVHVAADATSSRASENWRLGLDRMGQSGIFITPTETILFQLLEKAGSEQFKAVQSLIK
jgi:nicotinamidase-related amidase